MTDETLLQLIDAVLAGTEIPVHLQDNTAGWWARHPDPFGSLPRSAPPYCVVVSVNGAHRAGPWVVVTHTERPGIPPRVGLDGYSHLVLPVTVDDTDPVGLTEWLTSALWEAVERQSVFAVAARAADERNDAPGAPRVR